MKNKIKLITGIIILLGAAGYFLYGYYGPVERSQATLDKQYWYVETPAEKDGCYDIFIYGAKNPETPISQLQACDDRIKDIEFVEGMLSLTTRCGRRYTADVDKNRDFYDNNFCYKGTFMGGLFSSRVTLNDIEEAWEDFEKDINVRPVYSDAPDKDRWEFPVSIQDIGNNTLLLRLQDDTANHIILARLEDDGFVVIEELANRGALDSDEWANLHKQYGYVTEATITYTTKLLKEEGVKEFVDMTKVGENVFVKTYWAD